MVSSRFAAAAAAAVEWDLNIEAYYLSLTAPSSNPNLARTIG